VERHGSSTGFRPAETLWSRTYLGLIGSQFLAAFNDQAIHIVAIFYAGDMLIDYAGLRSLHENTIIALVTACFVLPFFLFSTLAGMLADRYSKRSILVFWKVAEVAITALALVGFLLPHTAALGWADSRTLAIWSAGVVVSCVFLMGTHSAFFVPAKYGVMPEILQHSVLSKGNGFLEATSFVAQILGTVFGAGVYGAVKSRLHHDTHSIDFGREWVLGAILVGLAVLGTVCSLLIERMPPAAPDRPLTWKLWQPLGRNIRVLLRSRPLALSVVGIAFFACLTLYARQTLIYDGEAAKDIIQAKFEKAEQKRAEEEAEEGIAVAFHPNATPKQKAELRVAILIALVGLGVGIGSPMAGQLSGNKVELGLVPIGTFFLILFLVLLAFLTQSTAGTVTCLILIGVAAGFYIVPLYTLLQHRAPKDSKGNLVATSNFVNVVGGLLAIGVFYLLTTGLEKLLGIGPNPTIDQLELKRRLTEILFLVAALMTAGMLFLLCQQLPDFFTRTLLWLRSLSRYHLHVVGLNNLPSDGPVILATNCETPEGCMQVLTATDRFTRFILLEHSHEVRLPWLLRYLTKRTHLAVLKPGRVGDEVLGKTLNDAIRVLERGEMVGLPAEGNGVGFDVDRFLARLRARIPGAEILPVYCGPDPGEKPGARGRARVCVVIGKPAPADTPADEIRRQIHDLAASCQDGHAVSASGATPAASGASQTGPAEGPPGRP
jgi:acyl-[acyl-carrier-protein]-phospholipid O-acyltransferase/long-chain-fatty-acid--[acyl-carrier-protein] ligase